MESTNEDETNRLKELTDENENLKMKNFRLKTGLAITEKSITQLESVIKTRESTVLSEMNTLRDNIQKLEADKKEAEETSAKMLKKLSKELKKEIEMRKELQKSVEQVKVVAHTNGNGVASSNGTNGVTTATNGTNGVANGHHEDTDFDSKLIDIMKVIKSDWIVKLN